MSLKRSNEPPDEPPGVKRKKKLEQTLAAILFDYGILPGTVPLIDPRPPRKFYRPRRKMVIEGEFFGFPFSGETQREATPLLQEVDQCVPMIDIDEPRRPCHSEPEVPDTIVPLYFEVELYAFLTKFEPSPEGDFTEVIFECVRVDWFDTVALNLDRDTFWLEYGDFPSPRVQMREVPCTFGEDEDIPVDLGLLGKGTLREDTWYRLTITDDPDREGYPAISEDFHDTSVPPIDVLVVRMGDPIPEGTLQSLLDKFSLREPAVDQHVGAMNQSVAFVGALDIGQGGCNALFNANGVPFLYYDLGRAKDGNEQPPGGVRSVCMNGNPAVVLSHWDEDHYQLPLGFEPAHDLPWLVTITTAGGAIGPHGGKVANRLTHYRLWPHQRWAFEEYNWGFILKADAAGGNSDLKNRMCLVLLVRVQDDPTAPPVGQRRALDIRGARPEIFPEERYVLMPGDAMLHFIPTCREHDLDGTVVALLAPHHGAQTHMTEGLEGESWSAIPEPAPGLFNGMPPAVVYTYGINAADTVRGYGSYNQYGHPGRLAVQMYARRGYHYRLNTVTRTGDNGSNYADHRSCIFASRLNGAAPAPGSAAAVAAQRASTVYLDALADAGYTNALAHYHAEMMGAAAAKQAGANFDVAATNAYNAQAGRLNIPLAQRAAYLALTGGLVGATKNAVQNALRPIYEARGATLDLHVERLAKLAHAVAAAAPQRPVPQAVACSAGAAFAFHPAAVVAGENPVTAGVAPTRTVANIAPDGGRDAAFNNENITIVSATVNRCVVWSAGHGLSTNDHIALAGAPGGIANGKYQVTKIDGNYVHIVAGAAPFAGPALLGTDKVRIVETAPGREVVLHVGHGLADGAIAPLNRGAGPVPHRIRVLDADHYEVAAPPHAAPSRVRFGHVGGTAVTIVTTAKQQTMVRHPRHGLVPNANTAVKYAVDPAFLNANLTKAKRREHQIQAVLDADHYAINYNAGGTAIDEEAAVCGTPVRLLSAAAGKAIVRHDSHGKNTNDYVTISESSIGACNAKHKITKLGPNHYLIGGPVAQANKVDPTAWTGATKVDLLDVAHDVLLVRHAAHGNPVNPAFANGLLSGRAEAVAPVDNDYYTLPLEPATQLLKDATVLAAGNAATLIKTPLNKALIYQAGHNIANGAKVKFGGGLLDKQKLPITKIDADWFQVQAPAVDEVTVEIVQAGGKAAALLKTTPGAFLVKRAGHGIASGTDVAFTNGVVHGRTYSITKIDADYFSIPLVPGTGAYVDGASATAGVAVEVIKTAADRIVVREPGHNRPNASAVTFILGPFAGQTYTISKVNADYYAIAESDARESKVETKSVGGIAVKIYHAGVGAAVVRQQAHAVKSGDRIAIGGSANGDHDGLHVAQVVDADHYTIHTAKSRTRLDTKALAGAKHAVVMAPQPNDRLIWHKNHGLANGQNVKIAGAAAVALNAKHVITRLGRDHYTVPIGAAPAGSGIDAGATAKGLRCGTHKAGKAPQAVPAVLQPANHNKLIGSKSSAFTTGTKAQKALRVAAAPLEYAAELAACPAAAGHCKACNTNVRVVGAGHGLTHKIP
jgi:hypothetical protein